MEIKDTPNPIGTSVHDEAVNVFIQNMQKTWDDQKQKSAWWKIWKKLNFHAVTNFMLLCLDDLVAYLIEHKIPGADKKATVMSALEKIYDYVIAGMIPIPLKPFSGAIKKFILNVIISSSIDWIVEKYNSGAWRPKSSDEVVAQWYTVNAQLFGVPGGHRPKI